MTRFIASYGVYGSNTHMLDVKPPQTEQIFTAARLEDAVLGGAKRVAAQPSERQELLAACEQHFAGMRILNADHMRKAGE